MDFAFFLCPLSFVLLLMLYLGWYFSKANTMLKMWADGNNYQIVSKEYTNSIESGFPYSRANIIFNVRLVDENGIQKTAWVRCGNRNFGVFFNEVEVKWHTK